MARYFFHVADPASGNLVKDSEGRAFPCIHDARREAVGFAQDVVKHGFAWLNQTWVIVVTDEGGTQIAKIPLSEIRVRQTRPCFALRPRFASWEARFGQRILAWLLTAALVGVLLEATFGTRFGTQENRTYRISSAESEGSIVAIRFAPQVTAAEINRFLDAYNASVVGGPRPGGFFRVRIADAILPSGELAEIVRRMGQEKIVEFAAAVP